LSLIGYRRAGPAQRTEADQTALRLNGHGYRLLVPRGRPVRRLPVSVMFTR
jgi:hypothetical protein